MNFLVFGTIRGWAHFCSHQKTPHMKNVLSVVALLVSLTVLGLWFWKDTPNQPVPEADASDEYPILETMGYYQRFSHKLWISLEGQNWELANFYVHELEEVTEEFTKANVVDEGYELSQFADMMLTPAVEDMEVAVKEQSGDLALKNYRMLINACNACHTATAHGYIKVTVPQAGQVFNQDFGVVTE